MPLFAGAATRDVTPDPDDGIPLVGYGDPEDRMATGVHDPLSLSALAVSDGGTTAAVVSADLIRTTRELVGAVRRRLRERGVDLDGLVLAATHTHAGPHFPTTPPSYDLGVDVSGVARAIEDAAVEAVAEARGAMEPATMRVGRAENPTSAENRRARGGVNSAVRIPRGTVDPEVAAVEFETGAGRTVLFNYACHPVCTVPSETLVSADWPGYARDRLEEGGDVTAMFLNGACGDVNPRDRYATDRSGGEVYGYMEAVGDEVADAAGEALAAARETAGRTEVPVETRRRDLRLPLKPTPDRETLDRRLSEIEGEIERLEAAGEPGFDERHYDRTGPPAALRRSDRLYARTLSRIAEWDLPWLPAEMSYVGLGDVGLLSIPGEAFVEHGLGFKDRAGAGTLLVAGYANGHVGYLPTLSEVGNGGYENDVCRVAPGAIGTVREAGFDLVAP